MGPHGHVVPRADGVRARCGGPGLCPVCAKEQAEFRAHEVSESKAAAEYRLQRLQRAQNTPEEAPEAGGTSGGAENGLESPETSTPVSSAIERYLAQIREAGIGGDLETRKDVAFRQVITGLEELFPIHGGSPNHWAENRTSRMIYFSEDGKPSNDVPRLRLHRTPQDDGTTVFGLDILVPECRGYVEVSTSLTGVTRRSFSSPAIFRSMKVTDFQPLQDKDL